MARVRWKNQRRVSGRQEAPGSLDLPGLGPGDWTELSCLWDFWPSRLLDPVEAATGAAPLEAPVPGRWNSLGIPELAREGAATYRLRIRGVPREHAASVSSRSGSLLCVAAVALLARITARRPLRRSACGEVAKRQAKTLIAMTSLSAA